ncbi:PD-(D/E)XK nuclease family protein [Reichenbachiella sp. MALMAid0571]|uniref:PD-(D/E)XK nuclease family protein n=1 Tax=Reichenbachiella sp. MALMAid0571 TaxID=3143939 RepID=UPI0032DE7F6F
MKNQSFLESLAKRCYDEYGQNADQLTIIFPNRRAGLFFRKHLSKLTAKPVWSPQIVSLEDFIISKSDLTPADQLQALFILYSVYKKLIKNAEGFDKFFFWGEMILKDFNELDSYLINSQHIFTIIQSQKELDESFYFLSEEDQKVIKSFWSGFLPKASKTQSTFLSTWKILNELYQKFREVLKTEQIAYKGMIYREVAEQIVERAGQNDDGEYWFAGFNALTASEERIIKYYLQEKKAQLIWDVDAYYLKDEYQESGYFFRQYQKDAVFKNTFPEEIPNKIDSQSKRVEVISVSLGEGQVKAVGESLEELAANGFSEENTVIVLPDENLLLPLLNSIPKSVEKVNITMGYPLKNSRYFSFFESLLNLHVNSRSGKDDQKYHYFKHVLSLLNHEVCQMHFATEVDDLVGYIHENNRVNLTIQEIEEKSPVLTAFFTHQENAAEVLFYFEKLIDQFMDQERSTLDKSVLFHLRLALKNILNTATQYDIKLEIDVLFRIFKQIGGSTKVPFTGEPLEGIQIMGVLETRNLDFENVFILSMNEGTFPADSSNSSFIPFNIRKAFDLPVAEHHDALQSYLFYRLLQNADNVSMYYNNISEFNHSGELSRLVKQLAFESNLKIERKSLVNPVKATVVKPITIEKNNSVLDLLNEYLVNDDNKFTRLSPSALNTYLDCRLKFYFRYIEKIYEPEEVTDDLDPALFGNLLHTSMEYLYQAYSDDEERIVVASDFSSIRNLISPAIEFAFAQHKMSDTNQGSQNGRSIIAGRVIRKYIEAILKYDEAYAPFNVKALEAGSKDGYVLDLPIEVNGEKVAVALKGVIDRIDEKGGIVRVLDYKSGRDERRFGKMESLFDRKSTSRNKAVMQVFYYCLLYKARHPQEAVQLTPGIFNSRDIFSNDFDVKIKYGKSDVEDFTEVEAEYTDLLKEFVGEIFDPEVPFDQTDDTKKCAFCPYVGICMRG